MTRLRQPWPAFVPLVVLFAAGSHPLPAAPQTASAEPAKTPIDLILIVDTSATMVGKAGGKNVFPEVKKALKELVDASGPGDNVLLIPYDADVRARATAIIYGQPDKNALHGEIDAMKAAGLWTYTAAAIQKGLEEARRLDEAQAGGKHVKVVVLLTDGMNDPPPAVRGTAAEVRLNEVARRFQGMPWFVWQVQLGPRIDAGVDEAFRSAGFSNYRPVRTAAADLNQVRAEIVKAVVAAEAEKSRQAAERAEAQKGRLSAQAAEDARKAREDARQREEAAANRRAEAEAKERKARLQREEAESAERRAKILRAMAALAVLAVIAIIFVMLRRRPRPHGALQYWKAGEAPRTFEIADSGKRRLRLGPATGDLALTGMGEKGLSLSAARIEGQVLCVIEADEGVSLKFQGKPVTRLELYDRDEFQLGDYSLQYGGEVGPRTV
jgi:hypothetical protein